MGLGLRRRPARARREGGGAERRRHDPDLRARRLVAAPGMRGAVPDGAAAPRRSRITGDFSFRTVNIAGTVAPAMKILGIVAVCFAAVQPAWAQEPGPE